MKFIAIMLLAFAVTTAKAENIRDAALDFAMDHTDYKITTEIPKIVFYDTPLCKGICGFYVFKENVIKIDNRAKQDMTRLLALIVHELVHYLQYTNGKFEGAAHMERPNCKVIFDNELEAYEVQSQFLLHNGVMNFNEIMNFKRNFRRNFRC